jgi:hypothetical protein
MKGKTLVGAPELSDRAFEGYVNKTADAGFKLQVLDDAKSLVPAKADARISSILRAGRLSTPFVRRDGRISATSTISSSMARRAWIRPSEPLIGIVGIGGNSDYINSHPNTVLRFLSVVWRVIDATKKDASLYDLQAPI